MAFTVTLQSITNNLGTLQIGVQFNDDVSGYAAQKTYTFDKQTDMNIQDMRAHIIRDSNLIKTSQNISNTLQSVVGTTILI